MAAAQSAAALVAAPAMAAVVVVAVATEGKRLHHQLGPAHLDAGWQSWRAWLRRVSGVGRTEAGKNTAAQAVVLAVVALVAQAPPAQELDLLAAD